MSAPEKILVDNALLTQILSQLQSLQISQQALQAKVRRHSFSYSKTAALSCHIVLFHARSSSLNVHTDMAYDAISSMASATQPPHP